MKDYEIGGYCKDDATKWAEQFIRTLREHPEITVDEELMVGWFANAIEVAHDHRTREQPEVSEGTPSDEGVFGFSEDTLVVKHIRGLEVEVERLEAENARLRKGQGVGIQELLDES